MWLKHKKKIIRPTSIVLFFVMLLSLLSSCSRDVESLFTINMLPARGSDQSASEAPIVRVNIFVQGTADMGELFYNTSYYNALRELTGTAADIWTTHGISQHFFRFDIEWQNEERNEPGYTWTNNHFAYPLDPAWWVRLDTIPPQIPQIFSVNFYRNSLEWYTVQYSRAPGSYQEFIDGTRQLSVSEQSLVSRTIREISLLRRGEREISVMVTNFVGHEQERTAVQNEILSFLGESQTSAISTFEFDGFIFLVFGSVLEVVDFSQRLNYRLQNDPSIAHTFGLYTNAQITRHFFGNENFSISSTLPGVREVFEEDLEHSELELFRQVMNDDWHVFNIFSRIITDDTATFHLSFTIPGHLLIKNMIGISTDVSLYRVYHNERVELPLRDTHVSIRQQTDTDNVSGLSADIQVDLDTRAFGSTPQRSFLVVRIYEYLDTTRNSWPRPSEEQPTAPDESTESNNSYAEPNNSEQQDTQTDVHTSEKFNEIFNRLNSDIGNIQARHFIGELYLHLIYR